MVVEGTLTIFLSDLNDIGSMIENIALAIHNSMGSSSLVSAHPSILSILYIEQQITVLDINDDQDDSTTIDDTIGPDDDTSMGRVAVIVSSVAALFALFGMGGAYLRKRCEKSKNNDQRNQNSIYLYDEATMGGSISQ